MAEKSNTGLSVSSPRQVAVPAEAADKAVLHSNRALRLLDLLPSLSSAEQLHQDRDVFASQLDSLRAEASRGATDSKAEEVMLAQVLNWISPVE